MAEGRVRMRVLGDLVCMHAGVLYYGCLWVYVYGIRPKCETYTVYGCVCVKVYQAACEDVYGWETICVEVYEYTARWLCGC